MVQNGKSTLSAANVETYKAKGNVNLNLNLFVFATNYGGEPFWNCKGRLYELKIFRKTGENAGVNTFDLIRHYLPCVKDGRAGLYDKVNGTIYYSFKSGSDFVAGPVLDKPLDFVKWIWGNGNQWFDTCVWGKSGLRSEVDLSVREYSGDHCILGTRRGSNRYYPAYNYEKRFRYAYGTMPSTGNTTAVTPTNDVSYYMDTRYLIKSDLRNGYQSVTVSKNGGTPVELYKSSQNYLTGENGVALRPDRRRVRRCANEYATRPRWQYGRAVLPLPLLEKCRGWITASPLLRRRPVRDWLPARNGGKYLLAGGGAERPIESPFLMIVR